MIGEQIKHLRENTGISQAELARKLSTTRASVNAWESGLSAPTAIYLIELSKLFHVSTDYLLGIDDSERISLAGLSKDEIKIIYKLLEYFDKNKESKSIGHKYR
ncbi:MAG: helix-turn-helix transcriptional regulator [Lachnospiraceae bacterium]|nr:helix-turn-helix transcriptional regulator [Candidatus Darwinimomas equi]